MVPSLWRSILRPYGTRLLFHQAESSLPFGGRCCGIFDVPRMSWNPFLVVPVGASSMEFGISHNFEYHFTSHIEWLSLGNVWLECCFLCGVLGYQVTFSTRNGERCRFLVMFRNRYSVLGVESQEKPSLTNSPDKNCSPIEGCVVVR